MSKSLKKAILRHPLFVSGDDRLQTEADIIATAVLVLDRIADERDCIEDDKKAAFEQMKAQQEKTAQRRQEAQEAFENYDFPARVVDSDGWRTETKGCIPAYMWKIVYIETEEGPSKRAQFTVEWSTEGKMAVRLYL
jgi:hypothetical protein